MNLKDLFNKELRALRASTTDQELIQAIDEELAERFDDLVAMYYSI